MKILGLYNNPHAIELFQWLEENGNDVTMISEELKLEWCKEQDFDLTVSYTYRYILTKELLESLNNNVVNIHISYLPWNRGSDPNLWSILNGTPRGVTLHYIDEQLDHGDIIAQELVEQPKPNDTLRSTYDELDRTAKKLFKTAFQYYGFWTSMRKKPLQKGDYHSTKESVELKKVSGIYDCNIDVLLDFRNGVEENKNEVL